MTMYQKTLIHKIKFYSIILILCFSSCQKNETDQSVINKFIDTSLFRVDSFQNNLSIDKKRYCAITFRNKYDKQNELYDDYNYWFAPISIKILDNGLKEIVNKKFDNFNICRIVNNDSKTYLKLISSAGGSGFKGELYFLSEQNNQINFNSILKFSELSCILFSKNGNSILHLDGCWLDGEGHFDNHLYKFSKYSFIDNKFVEINLGYSKNKYPSKGEISNSDILRLINENEPGFFANLNLDDFTQELNNGW